MANSVWFLQTWGAHGRVPYLVPCSARSIPPSLHHSTTTSLCALCDRRSLIETTSLLCLTNTFLIDCAYLQQAGLRTHTPFYAYRIAYPRQSQPCIASSHSLSRCWRRMLQLRHRRLVTPPRRHVRTIRRSERRSRRPSTPQWSSSIQTSSTLPLVPIWSASPIMELK